MSPSAFVTEEIELIADRLDDQERAELTATVQEGAA